MRIILKTLTIAGLTLALTACALLQQVTGVDRDARYSAKVALTAYADFIQPAILAYGHLPDCNPAPKPLCKDHGPWQKVKAAEDVASSSIAAAGDVLTSGTDMGKINQAIADISAVEAAFKAAKGVQ